MDDEGRRFFLVACGSLSPSSPSKVRSTHSGVTTVAKTTRKKYRVTEGGVMQNVLSCVA